MRGTVSNLCAPMVSAYSWKTAVARTGTSGWRKLPLTASTQNLTTMRAAISIVNMRWANSRCSATSVRKPCGRTRRLKRWTSGRRTWPEAVAEARARDSGLCEKVFRFHPWENHKVIQVCPAAQNHGGRGDLILTCSSATPGKPRSSTLPAPSPLSSARPSRRLSLPP